MVFDWLAQELQQRDPREKRTVVAIMDGETKLRDLQEMKLKRAIGILDIWHVTEYLYDLAYCFYRDGSKEAEAFVETYLRKLLEGKVKRTPPAAPSADRTPWPPSRRNWKRAGCPGCR